MKTVLVRPPFYSLFGVTTAKMKTYPLNLLYLATYINSKGLHEAAIIDGENFSPNMPELSGNPELIMNQGSERMVGLIENPNHEIWKSLVAAISAEKPDLVGITCNSGNMDTVALMTKKLRNLGLPVILGGSHPTVLPEQSLMYTGADFVVTGEGEVALHEVLDAISKDGSMEGIPSLARRINGQTLVNDRGRLLDDLNELPIPDRSLIDRSRYFGEVVMTGRGCPFDCAYCASRNIWGKRVRLRSTENISAELHYLKKNAESSPDRPGAWVIKIVDDTFTVNKKRTVELLDSIVDNGLNCFEFTGGVRADTLDEVVVEKMHAANFKRVTLGVESGSPKILKLIRKGETNEQVKRSIGMLRKHGIASHAFFMIGFPGETGEDIDLSKELILDSRPDYVEVNMVTPYPGTDLFGRLIREDPMTIDKWYRWFHQGMSTHSDSLGYNLDAAYSDFLDFAGRYNNKLL